MTLRFSIPGFALGALVVWSVVTPTAAWAQPVPSRSRPARPAATAQSPAAPGASQDGRSAPVTVDADQLENLQKVMTLASTPGQREVVLHHARMILWASNESVSEESCTNRHTTLIPVRIILPVNILMVIQIGSRLSTEWIQQIHHRNLSLCHQILKVAEVLVI